MLDPTFPALVLCADSATSSRIAALASEALGGVMPVVAMVKAEEGMRRLREGAVGVLLLHSDIASDGGLSLLREARAGAAPIPVIYFPEADRPGIEEAALDLGAVDSLREGEVTPRGLARALRVAGESRGIPDSSRGLGEVAALLLEAVPEAVMATDRSGRLTYLNPAASDLFGWDAGAAVGKDFRDLAQARVDRERADEIAAALREGGSWQGELAVRSERRDRFASLAISPLRASTGEVVGCVAVGSDLTRLRESEIALRERIKELRVLTSVGEILGPTGQPIREQLQRVVEVLPSGWLHPEDTEARLFLDGETVQTAGFRETPWMQRVAIPTGEEPGWLEIAFTGEPTPGPAGPFLPEEYTLLDQLARILGTALDRASLDRLVTQALSGIQDAVLLVGTPASRRQVRYVNAAAERIFGYPSHEMVGSETEGLHESAETYLRFGQESQAALATQGFFQGRFPMRRRSGELFEAEQTVALLDPARGLDGGVVSIVRDVSAAERADRALRESEERFRQIAEHIEDVFWVATPGMDSMEYVSPAYEKVWGHPVEALLASPGSWLDSVLPEDRERVRTAAARQADAPHEQEYRIRRRDGEERWILDRSFPVRGADGKVSRIIGVARDVTERAEMERRVLHMQKMESVGRLAGGIAHDFNNLLTVIRFQTDLIRMDLPPGRLADDVAVIQASADRAAGLTAQLLAFSRDQILNPRTVDLAAVVRTAGKLVERVIGENIRLEYVISPALPPVRIDPHQLEQVILNLAVNARDAMQAGGTLTLSVYGEAPLAGDPDPPGSDYVVLSVSDTGVGMTEEVQRQIFEPFFTTKPHGKGTGLGLAMVYGTVRQSGGDVQVTSAPGRGSTFALRFPAAEGPAESYEWEEGPQRGEAPDGLPSLSVRILVVEDEPLLRKTLVTVLRRAGHEVAEVGEAEAALGLLAGGEKFDLVLTDLILPGMRGQELVERIRASRPGLPIVVMSGYAEGADGTQQSLPEGVPFLAKPFTSDSVIAAVRRSIDRA